MLANVLSIEISGVENYDRLDLSRIRRFVDASRFFDRAYPQVSEPQVPRYGVYVTCLVIIDLNKCNS